MWKVNIEDIESAKAVLRRFNQLDLRLVELYSDGVKIEYPPEAVERFLLTGLSNCDFALMEFWSLRPADQKEG